MPTPERFNRAGDPDRPITTFTLTDEPIRDVVRVHHFLVPGGPPTGVSSETYVRVGALPKELQKAARAALQPALEDREWEAQQRAISDLPKRRV
jgi:hypothetical protein